MKICWAKPLGGCSEKFSREHYVGRELLKNMRVRGLHPDLEGRELPATALNAHLLCKNHNSELSDTDQEAINLHEVLSEWFKLDEDVLAGNGFWTPAHYEVNGALFGRWLCKLHCNLRSLDGVVPAEYYVRTAFGEHTDPSPRFFLWLNPGGNLSYERRIWYADYTIGLRNSEEHILFHVYFMGVHFVVWPFDLSEEVKTVLARKTCNDFYLGYWMETPSQFIWKQGDIQTKFLVFDWTSISA
jgi:hypothetical protein